ncbi:MAG: hypothetical protein M3Z32_04775 [Acidobacteriota bacterium]|nr:hypothetical protein [Acidobacteriota bacterium]
MRPLSTPLIGCVALLIAAPLSFADKKSEAKFEVGPAASYPSKQTSDNVTIAAVAYDTDDLAHTAFGKVNPYQSGVLPVLVIIQNDTQAAIRMDNVKVEYVSLDGSRIEATPPLDVKFVGPGPKRPQPNTGSPIPPGLIKHKKPLAAWEIEGRAFAAKMLPPHESASGFFYFQTRHQAGAKLYLTGLREASSGKEILYFEIPLDKAR